MSVRSALFRFREAKAVELGIKSGTKRPTMAAQCETLSEAERWRSQIIRETSQKILQIQNCKPHSSLTNCSGARF